jgi:hypothetical protein
MAVILFHEVVEEGLIFDLQTLSIATIITRDNVSHNQHFDKKSDIGPKDGTVCGPQMIEEQSTVIIPPAEETIISKAVRSTFTEECRT